MILKYKGEIHCFWGGRPSFKAFHLISRSGIIILFNFWGRYEARGIQTKCSCEVLLTGTWGGGWGRACSGSGYFLGRPRPSFFLTGGCDVGVDTDMGAGTGVATGGGGGSGSGSNFRFTDNLGFSLSPDLFKRDHF